MRHDCKATNERLPEHDFAAFEVPRSNHDVSPLDGRPEPFDLFERRRVVGVAKQHVFCVGVPHAVAHRVPFAAVSIETKHGRRRPSQTLDKRRSAIGAAIIDHEHFDVVRLRSQVVADVRQGLADPADLVERGNDDGQPPHGVPRNLRRTFLRSHIPRRARHDGWPIVGAAPREIGDRSLIRAGEKRVQIIILWIVAGPTETRTAPRTPGAPQ